MEIQSETAIRHVATQYPYDTFSDNDVTLRGNTEQISEELTKELQERLAVAGVEVIETRLNHLAYATEIASSMLQRQQAKAILAARQTIVEACGKHDTNGLRTDRRSGKKLILPMNEKYNLLIIY